MNRPAGCNCPDFPCCGCGEEPSQEEQHEQFEESEFNRRGPEEPYGEPEEQHEAPMTDWEADTPMGQEYGDGFEQE